MESENLLVHLVVRKSKKIIPSSVKNKGNGVCAPR